MFNSIAGSYDFLNHFLSFGIDYSWRRKLIRELLKKKPAHVIDIATGTADLAILAVNKGVSKVTGIDLSEGMVSVGLQKVAEKKLMIRLILSFQMLKKCLFLMPLSMRLWSLLVFATLKIWIRV